MDSGGMILFALFYRHTLSFVMPVLVPGIHALLFH